MVLTLFGKDDPVTTADVTAWGATLEQELPWREDDKHTIRVTGSDLTDLYEAYLHQIQRQHYDDEELTTEFRCRNCKEVHRDLTKQCLFNAGKPSSCVECGCSEFDVYQQLPDYEPATEDSVEKSGEA